MTAQSAAPYSCGAEDIVRLSMKRALAGLLVLAAFAAVPSAAETVRRDYPGTRADFRNPERGFWRFVAEDFAAVTQGELADVRASGMTMAYGVVRLDAYRNRPLPERLLKSLDAAFARTRKAGIKIILRFAYNYPENEHQYRNAKDAPLDVVQGHIAQLKPALARNADVIAALQAGFIGAWGEGHTSSNGLTKPAAKRAVRDALLDALPEGRMLQWRYPQDVIDWEPKPPKPGRLAKLGLHNDCFLSSKTDVGTYSGNAKVRARQRAYAAALSRATLYGGETCDVGSGSERMSCEAILREGPQFHLATLNRDYNRKFIESWKDGGCYDEVSRSMGHRLRLVDAEAPDTVRRGETAMITLRLGNEGWARLHNPRPFQLVLAARAGGRRFVVDAARDIRSVEPEDAAPAGFTFAWTPPADAAPGLYDLEAALPDAAPALADDPAYAIRPANGSGADFGWNDATGRYRLGLTVALSSK